jgi:hypothetical protein
MSSAPIGGGKPVQNLNLDPLQPQGPIGPLEQQTPQQIEGQTPLQPTADVYGVKLEDGLGIGSIRASRGLGELASDKDQIQSAFPLDDLGKLVTHGRQGAGFRLDGGSLRMMWLSAKRFEESSGKGVELSMWLQGDMLSAMRQRMEDAGAVDKKYNFIGGAVDESAADKALLKRSGETWTPNDSDYSGKGLFLEEPGKFRVSFNPGNPEALKGALRIEVLGEDADATKALKEVIQKLGLQNLFAPPTPNALERFKLMRFLWQFAPDQATQLSRRNPETISGQEVKDNLAAIGHTEDNSAGMKAVASKLSDPTVIKRAKLALALLDKSPDGFLAAFKSPSYMEHGLLLKGSPSSYSELSDLNKQLEAAGISEYSQAFKEILGKEPSKEEIEKVAHLALLASLDPAAAARVVKVDTDGLKLDDVRAAVQAAGFDPDSDRIKNLRFEEVYPGYFTVVDPALPDLLAKEGARYLYSTADNADRVVQMLTGGQKSSYARMAEGLVITGKSSSADFRTGGAFGVFTRLVTQSAIDNKKSFYGWYGSRPFKLVLDRSLLGRTDWWGFNSDNYGKYTGLTKDNRSEHIIKTIQNSYGERNELMFPIGNDPAYVNYVVCESQGQKDQLIAAMKAAGLESFNGKPLEEFVRVGQQFFELPEDADLKEKLAAQAAA